MMYHFVFTVRRAASTGVCSMRLLSICISIVCTFLSLQRGQTLCYLLPLQCQFGLLELPLVVLVDGHLDGQDVIEQTAIALAAVLGDDRGVFGADERSLFQLRYILA